MPDKLWGGRFRQPPDAAFERFSQSFAFDRRLAAADARGTRAHAGVLARAGVLTAAELEAVRAACAAMEAEFAAVPPADQPEIEDVHTYILQRIEAAAGPVARKLQTGRSRNEQIALDLRLYLRDQRPALAAGLDCLLLALTDFADAQADVAIPGYTHLQRAQPVSLGHHALAYAEMLLRDRGRLADLYARMDECPLGSGALAGTPYAGREEAARELGFARLTQNSLDAVSDRDFACEFLFALALLGVHLSRFAEDWILYSSAEFGFLVPGDAFATGSSLMPQKRNPDALELIRGRAARPLARLQQLLLLLKNLPLAYNRDLQEDKEPVFDALDSTLASLAIAAGVVATTAVNRERCAAAAGDPALLATDRADQLVAQGVPFHDAHQQVGAAFTDAAAEPSQPDAVLAALARRDCVGGTAPAQVRAQATRLRGLFGRQ